MRIVSLTVAVLCAGCQSYGPPEARTDRTPRLVAGLNPTVGPVTYSRSIHAYDGTDIWHRIGLDFRLADDNGINERIVGQRDWLRGNAGFIRNASQRASPYLHFIVESLEQREMPAELALLPIIESAYNPKANSTRDAAGLWQFMAATGRDFDLRQTAWYDGRRDVVASSNAAMDYLTRLHSLFGGDWLLAMAAYNAGEGTVSRAITANRRRGLPTDYWHLNLPKETQDYVPRLLALSLLVRQPEAYGVKLNPVVNAPYFTVLELARPVDLERLATAAGIERSVLLNLNPAFLRKTTAGGPSRLLVPRDQFEQLSITVSRMTDDVMYSNEAVAFSTATASTDVKRP
jgi:membrane-bound lytic murein transglycosylase D